MPLFKKVALLDWLYPPCCALCQEPLRRGRNRCQPCGESLPRLSDSSCQKCGQHFDGVLEAPSSCPNCHSLKPAFDFATAALKSSEDSLSLIHQFKLLKRPELGDDLALLALPAFQKNLRLQALENPLLVPVPLHGSRLRSRRFNQAELIARSLSIELEIPLVKALKRVLPTNRQATLSRKERLQNLRNAFQLRIPVEKIADRNLILIDDVFTTGSTAQECARVLQKANPKTIAVFTIVRA